MNELFLRTLQGEYEDEEPWHAVHELRRIGTREVFELAREWCFSDDPLRRARGLDVIAQLGRTAEHAENSFPEESFSLVSAVVDSENDAGALNSGIAALGHLNDERGLPLILRFKQHPSDEVRFAVACALGSYSNDPGSVEALLDLMADADDDVRDWATFSLGVLGDSDSDEVRSALVKALDDTNEEVREEALLGLAKRNDLRVVPSLLRALQQDAVTYRIEEASRSLLGLERDQSNEWTATDYADALRARFPGGRN